MSKVITNSFTVDLEDWFQGNEYIGMHEASRYEDRIEASTHHLLDLFSELKISATFFILGHVAENKRNLIEEIFKNGHEIASHGYSHELVYRQSPDQFRQELRKSKNILEDIIGQKILGHRASNWTITEKSLWALDIIREEGFVYDSSIFPTKNYLFGIPNAPRFAHLLPNGLMEIPPSTLKFINKTIPFSGGFFLRALPQGFLHWGIERLNAAEEAAVIYIHPWELDINQPKNLPLPRKNRFIHYYGIRRTEAKLRSILKTYKFDRMDRVFAKQLRQVG